jgi:YHS domain-containing protein
MYIIVRILNILLVVAIIYVLYKVLWKGESLFKNSKKKSDNPQKAIEEIKKDPICGTYVPVGHSLSYKSGKETHYFCSEECKSKYIKQENGG